MMERPGKDFRQREQLEPGLYGHSKLGGWSKGRGPATGEQGAGAGVRAAEEGRGQGAGPDQEGPGAGCSPLPGGMECAWRATDSTFWKRTLVGVGEWTLGRVDSGVGAQVGPGHRWGQGADGLRAQVGWGCCGVGAQVGPRCRWGRGAGGVGVLVGPGRGGPGWGRTKGQRVPNRRRRG